MALTDTVSTLERKLDALTQDLRAQKADLAEQKRLAAAEKSRLQTEQRDKAELQRRLKAAEDRLATVQRDQTRLTTDTKKAADDKRVLSQRIEALAAKPEPKAPPPVLTKAEATALQQRLAKAETQLATLKRDTAQSASSAAERAQRAERKAEQELTRAAGQAKRSDEIYRSLVDSVVATGRASQQAIDRVKRDMFPMNAKTTASEGHAHKFGLRTGSGAPTHAGVEGFDFYWDTAADILYANNNGSTAWTAVGPGAAAAHNLLSATHTGDAVTAAVAAGALIYGNTTPAWDTTVQTAHSLKYAAGSVNAVNDGSVLLRLTGHENGSGSFNLLAGRLLGGSLAVPTATPSGATMLKLSGEGLGTVPATGAYLAALATQLWTATAHGSKWEFYTTPDGSTTNTLRMTLPQDGGILLPAIATPATPASNNITVYAKNDSLAFLNDAAREAILDQPLRTIVLTAGGGAPTTTTPCTGPTQVESTTNDVNYRVLDFNTTTDSYAFWGPIAMPDNYDGGDMTARFYWTAASGSGTVMWAIQLLSLDDDDAIDTAWGTAVSPAADTLLAAGDVHVTAATGAITPGGTAVSPEMLFFRVFRDVSEDTLGVDARLIAVKLTYTTDAFSDV